MIAVILNNGETVHVDADLKSVVTENSTLTLRRGNTIVGRFRRYTGYFEVATPGTE